MFERWGRVVYRRRRLVLVIALITVALAAVWGTGVFGKLQSSGGFTPPNSQSQQSSNIAAAAFGRDAGDVVVLYSSPALRVASPAYRTAVARALAALPTSKVASYETYWTTKSPQFVSRGGRDTYAVLALKGADDGARQKSYDAIKNQLGAPGLRTQVGGTVPANEAINKEVTSDIGRAEGFSMPVLLIVLLVIFGSLAAASLPLAIGGIAILGSFTALRLLTLVTTVSIYSVNITTILGLGLGIDYGLFLVSRFREELHRHDSVEDAVARTVATAGRTVAVSGITVAAALAGLMLFPETFLRSMGYGGVATVLVDMLAALTVMPALLAVLGPRVNALRIRRTVRRPPRAEGEGAWYRLASSVMRRPLVYAIPIVVALLALGSPFLRVTWGGTDATALPASAPSRVVTEALNRDFPGNPTAPIESVVQFPGPVAGSPARAADLTAYASRLGHVPGVSGTQVTGVHGDTARIDIRYGPRPYSPQARTIVAQVRDVAVPPGARAYVGGQSAQLVDELASLGSVLPWMGLVVALATFVLLFLAFGSVVLPVKAIAMNVLSLSAMYGVVVWIFQEGHLSRLLQFTPTGTIDPTMPILIFAIMFGLSMDYEVFLLSRIRERYDLTGDTAEAVASGLQRTGGLITSLALLLVIVVGAFSASGITFIKLLGVGMIVALIVDATIVRVLLVPAVMRLLGRANWWAPRPLRGLYGRYGIREADAVGPAAPVLARR
ncbi:MAG TPA: MMPL family transporter [Streptosporangiaceae bacterium]|nr:MMPL family transporter [Streptosporangiaceae bacterium]